MMSVS